jgi:hypothetical protein
MNNTTLPHHYGIHVEAMQDMNMSELDFKNKCGVEPHVPLMYSLMIPQLAFHTNVLAIYAGYIPGPNGTNILNADITIIVKYILKEYVPGMKIIFDNSHEGGTGRMFARIHAIIDQTKIPASAFHYVTSVINLVDLYEDFCDSCNITEKINLYGVSTFELNAKENLSILEEPVIANLDRSKTFLCFNRVIRTHRVFLLCMLLHEDLVKDSFYSFFPNGAHVGTPPQISQVLNTSEYVYKENDIPQLMKDAYAANESSMPLTLNIRVSDNKVTVDAADYSLFNDSLFSLVTETFFFPSVHDVVNKIIDDNGIFFSEKIFKPIQMCHPFIIVSRPKSLEYLKKIGYQTFHPLIDESYDQIEDDGERLLAIVREVKRLNEMTDSEKKGWLKAVLPRALHNYLTLHLKTNKDMLVAIQTVDSND